MIISVPMFYQQTIVYLLYIGFPEAKELFALPELFNKKLTMDWIYHCAGGLKKSVGALIWDHIIILVLLQRMNIALLL